ncbi:MAG: thioredoxin domain-containing protein [Thermodesulfovibrionales bacterium]
MKQAYVLRCGSCGTLNSVPAERAENRPFCGRCRAVLQFPSHTVFVSSGTFDRDVLQWPGLVLVEFYDEWCHYCQEIAPELERLAAKRQGMLKIVKIDIKKDPGLSLRYNVKGAPSFLLFRNSELLARLDGSPGNVDDLEKWILLSLLKK